MTCPSKIMDFSTPHHRRSRLPFDQLREHPGAVPEEIPVLLERLTDVPDLAIRGVRHARWWPARIGSRIRQHP
ncbi:hypothetical protein ACFWWT_44090 [Streptomyces sp. NPDC058676]|uniref:hypothetical protein n=1 Tax=unclassified Streptomyces TaxID=2593676 RepID=UPI00365F510F